MSEQDLLLSNFSRGICSVDRNLLQDHVNLSLVEWIFVAPEAYAVPYLEYNL
jgi:hypothetical protein